MKKKFAIWLVMMGALCAPLAIMHTACTTPQKTIAYQTLFSVEQTTTAAFDSYLALVVDGKVTTNDVPKVAQAYNRFHTGMQVASTVAQFNYTNAAPNDIVMLANEVLAAILKAKGQ